MTSVKAASFETRFRKEIKASIHANGLLPVFRGQNLQALGFPIGYRDWQDRRISDDDLLNTDEPEDWEVRLLGQDPFPKPDFFGILPRYDD